MYRTFTLPAIVAVTLAVPGFAQRRDFSGTWNIDQTATDAANTTARSAGGRLVSAPTGFPMTIKQTADALVIERRSGDSGATNTTTYRLDGVEREVRIGQDTAKAKARWSGDTIIIEIVRAGQTTIATYAIDQNGVLWVETKAPQGTTRRAFKRSGAIQ